MKRALLAGLFLVLLLSSAQVARAYRSPGAPTGAVNDFAQVLSAQTKQALETELVAFEQSTTNEITVAIVPNMGGDYIENYAVKLFEEWRVGKAKQDNGVLLLLAIEERKMRIEVGYGLEGALPDSLAQRILDNEMTPKLKAGDYDGAVTAGVAAIELATKGEYAQNAGAGDWEKKFNQALQEGLGIFAAFLFILQFPLAYLARSRSWWAGGLLGLLGSLAVWWYFALDLMVGLSFTGLFTVIGLLLDFALSRAHQTALGRGVQSPGLIDIIGRSSGGGGGFGGFGGGSSGGGGASGSW